jgi:hypothetical protein
MKIETKFNIAQKVDHKYTVSNTIYGPFHDFLFQDKVIAISPMFDLLIVIDLNSIYRWKRIGVPLVYNVITNLRYRFGYGK